MMNQKFQDKDFYNNGFDLIRYWGSNQRYAGTFCMEGSGIFKYTDKGNGYDGIYHALFSRSCITFCN